MRLAAAKHFVASVRIFSALLFIFRLPMCSQHRLLLKDISNAFNVLGDAVYKELAKTPGNILFSPFAIYCSLTLLILGADENAQLELLSKLFNRNVPNVPKHYEIISRYLHNHKILHQDFHVAYNIFLTHQYPLLDPYKKKVTDLFSITAQQVDFTNTAKTASIMNKWLTKKTNESMGNIVDANSFNEQTSLVLLNAIYFRSRWNVKFDETDTMPNYIFRTAKGITRCNMMLMKRASHDFYSESNIMILSPTLHDTELKIAFISTIGKTRITEIEQKLDHELFFYFVSQLRPVSLTIKIPKFTLEEKYSLKDILISAGYSQMMQTTNFSNMFTNPVMMSVDQIIQKAVVQVNEAGTNEYFGNVERTQFAGIFRKFVLDRPFLLLLYNRQTQTILLRGRIETPSNSAEVSNKRRKIKKN